MNLQFYVEKLNSFDKFKYFMTENPSAFPCSGFFMIDKTGKESNKQHFDFWVPETEKLMSFQLEDMQVVPLDNFGKIPDRLSLEQDINFDEIEKLIEERIVKEGLKDKIQKMLFSLQVKDGKNFIIGTVFVPRLGLVQVEINLENMEVTNFSKKSFMDMINVFKKKEKKG